MPWTELSSQSWDASEDRTYKGATFAKQTAAVAWGVSVDASGSGSLPRRRIGFLYWYFVADDRDLYLPTVEVFSGVNGRPLALSMFTDSLLDEIVGLSARVTVFGYAFAPDRGCTPCTARLLRLNPP